MAHKDRPQAAASAVMSFPQPPLRKSDEYLKAYTNYAYTAISAISQEVASIVLKLFQTKFVGGKPESTQLFEHEVLSLLHFVNPLTTFYDQVEATQIYLELTGEAFWVLLKDGDIPKEIWLVRPDWMKIVPDKDNIIKHYIYNPGGVFTDKVIFPKENVIHFKYFNPLNPYRGKGSIQAAALPLDTHAFSQEWNRNFFFNSAIPGMVFTTEKKLNEKVIKRFLNQWQASYGGRSKSNKIAFLGGGMKLDKITMGAKEMDFAAQQRMMRDDILAVFKVPKSILGLTEDVNRANAEATNRSFMERVVTPRMTKFVGALNEFLLPMYPDSANLFFDFTDPSPEDVEIKLKRYANARKFTWMTPNEIRIEENLEPVEGGDDLFAPLAGGSSSAGSTLQDTDKEEESKGIFARITSSKKKLKKIKKVKHKKKAVKHMIPIPPKKMEDIGREKFQTSLAKDITKMIGAMLKVKNGEDAEVKEKKKDPKFRGAESLFNDEGKDAYWKAFIEVVTKREKELKDKAIDLFNEQEKVILDRLDEVKYWKKDLRKGKESSVLPNKELFSRIWITTFIPIIRDIVIEQGNFVLDFLGTGGNIDLLTETSAKFLRTDGAELVTDINETTREQLRKALAEGFVEGESIPQLRKRIQHVFNVATISRAGMIARTEALRASNFATVEAYKQSGVVEAKEWLTERDDRVCPWCLAMDGKVIGLNRSYFKEGDSFTVDGKTLEFNLLDVNEPPLHPNCRCTTIPVLLGQKSRVAEKKASKKALSKEKKKKTFLLKELKQYKEKDAELKSKIDKGTVDVLVEAEKDAKSRGKKIVARAEKKADKIVKRAKVKVKTQGKDILKSSTKQAKKKAKTIIKKAKEEAEEEKKGIIFELSKLRDKARRAIYGKEKS